MGERGLVDEYASRQYGVFNRKQAREAGFDRFAVRRRIESGEWLRLCPNVYCLASAPPRWERQLAAAVLSRPRAYVGGVSAAYLLGLRGFAKGRPTVVVPAGANARLTIGEVIRSRHFDSIETVSISGFVTTSTAETLMALARQLDPRRLELSLEDALLTRKVTPGELKRVLGREQGAPWARVLGDLVLEHSADAPSPDSSYIEAILERLLAQADVPSWSREFPFSIRGQPARVDVFVPEWDLVIEADGRNWHARRSDFEKDRRRDNELAAMGIQVIRLTYSMLTKEPGSCMRTVNKAGLHRSARRGG